MASGSLSRLDLEVRRGADVDGNLDFAVRDRVTGTAIVGSVGDGLDSIEADELTNELFRLLVDAGGIE